jgi:membrane protein YqaA with SNARE-associated domain
VLASVPAVDEAMIDQVGRAMESGGILAVFVGAFSGKPYKIYAVEAGATGSALVPFLLVSIPARLLRFVLVSWLVDWISRLVGRRWTLRRKRVVLAGFWMVFYTAFFMLMPS